MRRAKDAGFALYEVMLGLAIFAIGVIALGRAVNNCVTASGLSADDARVRPVVGNHEHRHRGEERHPGRVPDHEGDHPTAQEPVVDDVADAVEELPAVLVLDRH